MHYLALYVLCSALLGFIFKLYGRFSVDSFQAIIFNYFTCVLCGWLHLGQFPYAAGEGAVRWLPYALILGVIFVSGFNGAAATVRYFGVTISQIMQKMSILMTVPFAVLVFHESAGKAKVVGFLLALVAIVAVNWPKGDTLASSDQPKNGAENTHSPHWWIPLITWLLSGILEVIFVWTNGKHITAPGDIAFISTVFGTAGLVGLSVATVGWLRGKLTFSWRNVVGGIILGIPNYGSMLFLLLALGSGLEGSFVFPIGNVGVILVTTFVAVAFFHERLTRINWLGIALAVAAIVLISM